MNKNLGKQVRSGFGWDLIGTFFKQISTLAVSVILARLLTPEQFGIVGMALVFVSLSQLFVEVGFSQGLIQSEENTQSAYSSVFFLTIGLGIVVGVLIFFAAPLIGDFYENQQVTNLVRWLCLIPIISSFGSTQNTILTRDLNFKVLTFRNIFSTLLGGIIGVVMAYLDYGVFALVGQQISTAFFFTIIIWWKSTWKPSLVFSFSEIKELMNFSGYVFLDNLLRRFFMKLDTLFIGKYFSEATLGFYSRAESLNAQVMQYTTSSLRKILFPAFSKLQKDKKKFEESYFKVFDISTFIGVLGAGILFFLAEDIVITLLGEKWRPSVFIFQILVFRLIVSPFGGLIGKAILAKGFSKANLFVGQIRRGLLLVPILVGYYYGIHAFTITLVIVEFFAFLVSITASSKLIKISFIKQVKAFSIPLLPLIFFIFIYYSSYINLNAFVWAFMYAFFYFFYSFLTKNKGLIISLSLFKSILKK